MIATRVPRQERMFAVLLHNQARNGHPHLFIERDTAQYWLDCGFAFRFDRWTLILKKPLPPKLRGASCSIRESTILAASSGSRYHQSLIEAWK